MQSNKSIVYKISIIILAVSLIASLTFIFLNKTVSNNTKASATYPSTVKNIDITEWGIKGHYMGALPLAYEIKDNVVRFTTNDIKDVCGYDHSAFITRYTADQHIDQKGYGVVDASTKNTFSAAASSLPKVHIGDYYYILTSAGSPCINAENIAKDTLIKNSEGVSMKISSAQGDVDGEVSDVFLTLSAK